MAVEVLKSGDRQIVMFTWDTEKVDGEIVQFHCQNAETGGVSTSGISRNDGEGYVTYPLGYSGNTIVTVYDNDGNTDMGTITVGDAEPPEATQPLPPEGEEKPPEVGEPGFPTPPIEIPDLPDHIWGPNDPRPTPPIANAPGVGWDDLPHVEHH